MARLAQFTIVIALLSGAFAIACGGGGGVTTETPEEYASAVCGTMASYADDFDEMGQQLESFSGDLNEDGFGQLGEALALMGPLFSDLSDDLDDIEPPSDIADQHESIVTAFGTAGDAFGELEDLLDQPLEEAVAGLAEFEEQFAGIDEGFEALASPGAEYQAAFENEPDCQELEDIFSQF